MENLKFYREKGYLIAKDLLTPDEVGEIKRECLAIFSGKRGIVDGMVCQSEDLDETEILRKYTAIHFPHKISNVIVNYIKHPSIVDILKKIVSPNIKCMQSMLFMKAPGKKGQAWHQDEYYIPTRDRSLTGVWIALDDATVENGCLWVIPGSQKDAFIRPRNPYNGNEYADTDCCDIWPYSEPKDAVPVEINAGSVVFFNGYLLHSSQKNKSPTNFRRALVNHYMSAESMLPWDMDGKIKLEEDFRDIVMVAGNDPYERKGTVSISTSFIRPDKLHITKG